MCRACDQTRPCSEFHRRSVSSDGLDSLCRDCRSKAKSAYYAANRDRAQAQQRKRRVAGTSGIRRRPDRQEPATDDKQCTACRVTRAYTEFNRRAASVDGLQPRCRDCEREAKALRYVANREAILADMRRRYAANPEKKRQVAREWAVKYPDRVRSRVKAWQQANPEKLRAYGRTTRERYPDKRREYTRIRRARKRAVPTVPFTTEQLTRRMSIFPGCWICAGPKDAVDHVKPIVRGGPHMLANLRPICRRCNSSKRDRWPFPTQVRWRAAA